MAFWCRGRKDYCEDSSAEGCTNCRYCDDAGGIELEDDELDDIVIRQWISVKDRLPEDDAHYLVWVSDACTVERAMYYGDGEWLTEELDNLTRYVTHWMPMPEPPKEE